jgi:hypothetical protein
MTITMKLVMVLGRAGKKKPGLSPAFNPRNAVPQNE